MSTVRGRLPDRRSLRLRAREASNALVRVTAGDRLGLVVFLGAVVFSMLTWRIGFFITDNYTLANTLVAMADGHLTVTEAAYGSLESPGMSIHDGQLYGRNYGQVAFALPFLWALRAATSVADFGLVFATLCSLLLLALAVQVGRLVDRPAALSVAGSVVALTVFAVNAHLAEPLSQRLLPVAALQLSAIVAAAFVASTAYRLFARLHGRRIGASVGVAVVAATPVGFWASIPKRHVYVVAVLFGVAYAFFRSRNATATDALLSATGLRALAYALVGLLTWVHAGEAFIIFLALALADLPTAPANDRRTLAVVGAVFAVSMLPFLLTNSLISGDPLRPPRMLSSFGELSRESTSSSGSGSASDSGGGPSLFGWLPLWLVGPILELSSRFSLLFDPFVQGARVLTERPGDVYQTLIRAGYIDSIGVDDDNQAINLTVLESAPVLAGLLGTVVLAGVRVRSESRGYGGSVRARLGRVGSSFADSAGRATDGFVVLAAVLFFLAYIPRLPIHAQVTVRYLLPLYALGVYGLARQITVRRVLTEYRRAVLWTYLGGVMLGSQLFFVVVTVGTFGRGGALQLHAVLGLAVGGAFGLLAAASTVDDRFDRVTAVGLGLAAALGTNLLVLSGVVYFQYGPYALPMVDWLADLVASV
jgi:hypothetical protein